MTSTAAGYTLEVDRGDVDVFRASELAELASARLAEGDPAAVVDICGRALDMFRGDSVLPDAGEREWLVPHRARLEEVRLGLIEDRVEARLQLGAGREVIGELEALVVSYPLRERLWELLVTALYRAGRQADALATYQRVKTQLADELGLDPGPRLQRLEAQILAQDAGLGALRRPAAGPLSDALVGNLPSMSVELVGRASELASLSDLLAVERLVEVVGPGGVGKTAVAVETGRRLTLADGGVPGGVWLARLETASTDEGVIDVLIAAMDVAGGEAALFERLRGIEAVVILDNCEHVLNAAAALAVRLLDAAPGVRVLCTSQVPLYVDGETVFELAPLALPDAVQLFTRRAAAQRSNDPPAGEWTPRCIDLCRSLDGLPLAIELAAARTKTLVSRGHLPTPRRPLRRAERPDQPQTRAAPVAQVDDPVELRPALPRRPAGPVGARHLRWWRAAAGGGVRPRSARCAGGCRDRRRRPAREPFAGDGQQRRRAGFGDGTVRERALPPRFVTSCSTASARSRWKR